MPTLREVSPTDPVTTRALDWFEEAAPVLEDLEFVVESGNASRNKDRADAADSSSLFRDLNEDVDGTAADRNYETVPKRIVQFKAKVDSVLEDRDEDPEGELMEQTEEEAYIKGFEFQNAVFNADNGTNAKAFDGFEAICAAKGLVTTPASPITVPLGNSDANRTAQQQAMEKLINFFKWVKASHAYMPVQLKTRLLTVAKALNYYRSSKDALGNEVEMIGDTIIRSAGFAADQSDEEVIKFNETVGGNSSTASIFACNHSEMGLKCATSAGMVVRNFTEGDFLVNSGNLDMTIVLTNSRNLHQYQGWALA